MIEVNERYCIALERIIILRIHTTSVVWFASKVTDRGRCVNLWNCERAVSDVVQDTGTPMVRPIVQFV